MLGVEEASHAQCPRYACIWGGSSASEGKAYLHLQVSGLWAAMGVLRV